MINYSVIIPHKNTPSLLQRCIDSIPQRDDIQIIIVDDNSEKEKVDFENFPGNNRKNVEIYLTKEGKGAGYARNVGLKHAKGKWLLFADADDFYHTEAFQTFDSYLNTDYDIIYFFAYSINPETGLASPREKDLNRFYKKYNPTNSRSADYIKFKAWEPWNKLINCEFWHKHQIYFDEIPFGNDLNFSLKLSLLAKKTDINTNKLYCLTYSSNSITYKRRTFEAETLSLELRAQLNIYFKTIKRPFWHKYLLIYFIQIWKTKGFKYFSGYILYLLKHAKTIRRKTNHKKQIIKDFFANCKIQ